MRRTVLVLLAALAAVSISGCTGGASRDPLDGRTFVSSAVTGRDLVAGTQITLSFSDGRLSADAGCNHLGGDYALDNGILRTSALSMTEMACEPAAKMDQDQWLSGQLTSGLHFALNGRTLTLTTNHVRIDLSERVSVDRPLTGTRWELQTIVTGTGPDATAEDATLTTDPATLVFEGDRVTLSAGVNGGSGPATISRGTITFGRLIVTLRPIRDDRRGQIETAVLSVLRGTVGYHLDGDALTVTATDGASALVYRAVTEATPEQ